jgi:hypothetical protein
MSFYGIAASEEICAKHAPIKNETNAICMIVLVRLTTGKTIYTDELGQTLIVLLLHL